MPLLDLWAVGCFFVMSVLPIDCPEMPYHPVIPMHAWHAGCLAWRQP